MVLEVYLNSGLGAYGSNFGDHLQADELTEKLIYREKGRNVQRESEMRESEEWRKGGKVGVGERMKKRWAFLVVQRVVSGWFLPMQETRVWREGQGASVSPLFFPVSCFRSMTLGYITHFLAWVPGDLSTPHLKRFLFLEVKCALDRTLFFETQIECHLMQGPPPSQLSLSLNVFSALGPRLLPIRGLFYVSLYSQHPVLSSLNICCPIDDWENLAYLNVSHLQ